MERARRSLRAAHGRWYLGAVTAQPSSVRGGAPRAGRALTADRLVGLLLFAGAIAWFAAQPRNLGEADESFILVQASRLLGGERLYRDMFQFIMPGTHWLVAAAFALFGTTITTAKMTIAVVNAATVVLTFAAARGLGVRPLLAVLPAVGFLALAQPAWPYVSPHWVSTALLVLLVRLATARHALERPRRLGAIGVTLGLIGIVQQQKVPATVAALVVAVLLACWIRRDASAQPWHRRLFRIAICSLAVVLPVLVVLLATVPLPRLLEFLVRFPLTGYRDANHANWGQVMVLNHGLATYVRPTLLRWLPALLPLASVVVAVGCLRGWPRDRVVQWSTLLVLSGFSALSILYFPDFIHIGFIAPPYFVVAALLLESALRPLPPLAQRLAAPLTAAVLLLGLGAQMTGNAARMRAEYPLAADTPFGRIDFPNADGVRIGEAVARQLAVTGSRDMFIYPGYDALYLTAGGRNATPFEVLLRGYNLPEHFSEAQAALDAKQVPTVVVTHFLIYPDDPFMAYLERRYEKVGDVSIWSIYRRRPDS